MRDADAHRHSFDETKKCCRQCTTCFAPTRRIWWLISEASEANQAKQGALLPAPSQPSTLV